VSPSAMMAPTANEFSGNHSAEMLRWLRRLPYIETR
jgi:hypothetical protein